ncbi:hypothetical protein ACTHO0_24960 [Cytobacillus praedii]|uniref:hypothetical protein n=1 Tax=Cytobacillus praedii TaxID=1742358 RepID=UPI003F82301A
MPDLVIVFINAIIYAVICFMVVKKSIPFSESIDKYNQHSNAGIIFGLMLFVALFAGLHYVSTLFSYGIYLYMVIAIICLAALWKQAFNITWGKLMG